MSTLHLFEAYGIELEYMIVSREDLRVLPIADQLLAAMAGEVTQSFAADGIGWSNELALHVIEFKTDGPSATLSDLPQKFRTALKRANAWLAGQDACLMGTGMHPWMDPQGVKLWPHGDRDIYKAFDRIFDCRGHGWGNLQSMHINLPFANDAEFARLHAAVRASLAILPALSASSPFMDGRATGRLCNRYFVYRENCKRIREVSADVVPEVVSSEADYQRDILEPLYKAIAPHDAAGILQHEWLNARGAIARFDRMALEIRLLDIQAEPEDDLAIAEAVSGLVRLLSEDAWVSSAQLNRLETPFLKRLLEATAERGQDVEIGDRDFLRAFGVERSAITLNGLWEQLIDRLTDMGRLSAQAQTRLERNLSAGPLAQRILSQTSDEEPSRESLNDIYRRLAESLQ